MMHNWNFMLSPSSNWNFTDIGCWLHYSILFRILPFIVVEIRGRQPGVFVLSLTNFGELKTFIELPFAFEILFFLLPFDFLFPEPLLLDLPIEFLPVLECLGSFILPWVLGENAYGPGLPPDKIARRLGHVALISDEPGRHWLIYLFAGWALYYILTLFPAIN